MNKRKKRRRSDLGRITRNAKRMRLKISKETEEEKAVRLSYNRKRILLRRASESPVEREDRLRLNRERQRARRAREAYLRRMLRFPTASGFWADEVKSAMDCVVVIECVTDPLNLEEIVQEQ